MTDTINLTLVFHERDPARLQHIAEIASDPGHERYGKHLDREQIEHLVRLPDAERQDIVDWVAAQGMAVVDVAGANPQLMFLRASREQVERSFGVELIRWLEKSGDFRGSAITSAMPRRLAGYIQKIGGLPGERGQMDALGIGITDGGRRDDASEPEEGLACGIPLAAPGQRPAPPGGLAGVAPADIASIYEFPAQWDGSGETIAILMLGGDLDPSDLASFWQAHGIRPPTVEIVRIGPVSPLPSSPLHRLEAAMSVEWAGAMAPGAKIVVYQIDPRVMGDPWSAFLMAIVGDRVHAPTIACTSWITPERRYYRLHGHSVVKGLLNQAAALGITVISAAGDWGAFDGIPRTMRDGRFVSDAPWPHGVFPAVEDRVLAVGGTMITTREPLTEVAWSGPPPPGMSKAVVFDRLAGSGGFSEDVPIPAWQQPALRGHYARGSGTPAVVPYGRGFPDVALMASGPGVQRAAGEPLTSVGYRAVACGSWIDYAGGTSVGAPIWAAIVARANQARREAGAGRLGFCNPLLYELRTETPSPFRSITSGAADVAMTVLNRHGRAVSYYLPGYECQADWNPVTGLGVPRVDTLIECLVARTPRTA